ncbi:unnamed protein product [Diamesa hyperborea]
MKIFIGFLTQLLLLHFATSTVNAAKHGAKSIIIYTSDDGNNAASNMLLSVEVDDSFFADILTLIKSKNKVAAPVSKIDSTSEFLRLVAGEDCKCQCMCCDTTVTTPHTMMSKTPTITTPGIGTKTTPMSRTVTMTTPGTKTPTKTTPTMTPTVTAPALRTVTPERTTADTKTTPSIEMSTTTPARTTAEMSTKTPSRTTADTKTTTTIEMTTKTPPRSSTGTLTTPSFEMTTTTPRTSSTGTGSSSTPGPTYLPIIKPSTASRLTSTRTYRPQSYGTFIHYFTLNNVGRNDWVPRSRRPTKSRVTTTTDKYDYLRPFIPFDPTNGKQ